MENMSSAKYIPHQDKVMNFLVKNIQNCTCAQRPLESKKKSKCSLFLVLKKVLVMFKNCKQTFYECRLFFFFNFSSNKKQPQGSEQEGFFFRHIQLIFSKSSITRKSPYLLQRMYLHVTKPEKVKKKCQIFEEFHSASTLKKKSNFCLRIQF